MPHVPDSKLFNLCRHKPSRRILIVVVVIVVLSSSRRGCKVCALPFGLAGCFTTYLSYLTSCDVVQCRAMSMSHRQSHAMWRDVARCCAMWDSDEFLFCFCYDCSSKKASQKFPKIFCWIVVGLYFYVFPYKSFSGTETMARGVSTWKARILHSPQWDYCRAGKKIRSLTRGIPRLRMRTLGDMLGGSLVYFIYVSIIFVSFVK